MRGSRTLNIGAGADKWGSDRIDIISSFGSAIWDFNIPTLPYKDSLFNEIRLSGVIEFSLNPQLLLEECHRVLMKGGSIELSTINIESKRFSVRPLASRYLKGFNEWSEVRRCTYYSIETLSNRLELAGFNELQAATYSTVFPFQDWLRFKARKRRGF